MRWTLILCLLTFPILCLTACGETVGEDVALEALTKAGWTDVKITEKHSSRPSWFGCDVLDNVAYKAKGINPSGEDTRPTICCRLEPEGCSILY